MKRSARLFALAEHLRSRRTGVTAEELAAHFGVTVRTIYRDLDTLRDAELPLTAERGRGGGYALDRAYSLPPVNFTAREAALLLRIGAHVREMRLVPFTTALSSALTKVRAALPLARQRELGLELDGLQFTGVPAAGCPEPVRRAVEEAWFSRSLLRLRYVDSNGVRTTRTVRLDAVVMERSLTLLNVDDLEKNERRQFRLDRIEWAEAVATGSVARDQPPSRRSADDASPPPVR